MNEIEQKEIEEMAKDLIRGTGLKVTERAEFLIKELGYRNVKDKIVLSKEKYVDLTLAKQSIFKMLDEREEQARKETAEKLIKFVSEHCDNETIIWQLDEFVAKQFGVEIKE
jgi:hypothetical protein